LKPFSFPLQSQQRIRFHVLMASMAHPNRADRRVQKLVGVARRPKYFGVDPYRQTAAFSGEAILATRSFGRLVQPAIDSKCLQQLCAEVYRGTLLRLADGLDVTISSARKLPHT
jgi:hypothetical protein